MCLILETDDESPDPAALIKAADISKGIMYLSRFFIQIEDHWAMKIFIRTFAAESRTDIQNK